ncbi:MAG: hypothetical protein QF890_12095 [Myxococcota bacterium]|nr:hypothetical protein [Deltaproteobacteria bacterium]MCP4239805.1 hypothetical protein [bacterium]MDP6074523.1 hypothetical protein [Myxococcota bacterium]MDP6243515.1 hypothetical protein [Myxococcota bacterium]MDP7073908.1 hypothetical protein [Myxococcota bacterium]
MRDVPEIVGLLGAGLVPCVAYLLVGLRLMPRLGPEARGAERLAWAWLLGTGVASLGILLLRGVGVPLPVLAAAIVAALFWPFRSLQPGPRPASDRPPASPLARRADTAAGAVAALLVLAALAPETFWDGFEYHLPLVAAWTEGPIRALPGMIDAEFRAGLDLLAVPAVTSGFPDAAASISAGFALALAALVRAEATRRASPAAGALAGLFVLLAPLTVELAPSTYVDLGVGAYGFGALLLADRWNRGGTPRDLTAAALCLAFAANAKLHAAVLAPAVLGLVLVGGRPPTLALLASRSALLLAAVAPWLVKAALTTGSPFFPLFGTEPAAARYLEFRAARAAANYPVARDPLGFAAWLGSLTFGRNAHVSGLVGPLPLALGPLALGRLPRATWALLGVCGLFLVPLFVFLPAARFGTPLWSWLAVAAAVGGWRLAASGAPARVVLFAALALVALHQVVVAAVALVPRVGALRAPAAYERARFPDQDALRRMVAQGPPVVGIPMGAVAWMPQPVYNLLWERNGELYFDARTPPGRALALLRARGVRSLVLDVEPPHPDDGRTGHPLVDAWLAEHRAVLARDVPSLPARERRRWVLVLLQQGQRPAR